MECRENWEPNLRVNLKSIQEIIYKFQFKELTVMFQVEVWEKMKKEDI